MINDKVFETATIRLSMDETRALVALSVAGAPTKEVYGASLLVNLGLAKKVSMPVPDMSGKIKQHWKAAQTCTRNMDLNGASESLRQIRNLESKISTSTSAGYVLTAQGEQVARGITIRLGKIAR